MKSLALNILFLMLMTDAFAGSVGGGSIPSIQIQAELLSDLKAGALEGELIRYTEPGSEPVYLLPDIENMKPSSITTTALPSGNTTVFYTEPDAADKAQKTEVTVKVKPTIETVPVSEIDQETLDKITAAPKAD